MAYSFVSGDTGSTLRVTCTNDSDSTAIDLTGCTLALRWKDSANVLQSKAMTIVTAASGIAEYNFAAGELFAPSMSFEVQITDATSKVIRSLNPIEVSVRAALS